MTNRQNPRRYRKTQGRHVWVFSELNHDLRPEQLAKILTAAGLEQARSEADAQAQREASSVEGDEAIAHIHHDANHADSQGGGNA